MKWNKYLIWPKGGWCKVQLTTISPVVHYNWLTVIACSRQQVVLSPFWCCQIATRLSRLLLSLLHSCVCVYIHIHNNHSGNYTYQSLFGSLPRSPIRGMDLFKMWYYCLIAVLLPVACLRTPHTGFDFSVQFRPAAPLTLDSGLPTVSQTSF